MNCEYEIIGQSAGGENILRCRRPECGHETVSAYGSGMVHTMCRINKLKYKTGDILHNLLRDKLGTGFKTGCACKAWIAKMNEWGPKGCRENLVKIVNALLAEAKRREWQLDGRPILSKVARIGACVPGSMCFARAWARRLVREAIRRSEQNEKS